MIAVLLSSASWHARREGQANVRRAGLADSSKSSRPPELQRISEDSVSF